MSDLNLALIYNARPPQADIPCTLREREELRRIVRDYAESNSLCAPLGIAELERHAEILLNQYKWPARFRGFVAVLINNTLWHDIFTAIPYNRRLLLVPKCLRSAEKCRGIMDEIGLICAHCGSCIINDLKRQAEELGYAVLIAEGSPVVMSLIETRQIEAILGVSCLSTLERVFPYMEAGAVPGIAIPLLYDGCENTAIDTDWLWEALYETSENPSIPRLNLEEERNRVDSWFSKEELDEVIRPEGTQTEAIAMDWIALSGKRWRPFLASCTFTALTPGNNISDNNIRRICVAVECFHKASLIHDDIEDNDDIRYGQETLHARYGIPVALNAGDLLIGWGYQLLSELDVAAQVKASLIECAAHAHRIMCLGQGEELYWSRHPESLTSNQVIEIFRRKTSPAFDVALSLGALLAGADSSVLACLHQYSEAMGVAYQIRDDLEDYLLPHEKRRRLLDNPSILMALATEQAKEEARQLLLRAWQEPGVREREFDHIMEIFSDLNIDQCARALMDSTKARAIESLAQLNNPALKGLLRRVISKIFGDFDLMGCCNDTQTGDDTGPGQGASAAG
ncbi:MAG: DUF116 domain-containing protein [Desulfatiglans sp.]|jgi:geranylgeranyl pyrophosphate synthase|nr:DUF116 domain-containing protein [Desulfatiglans sp.]